MQLLQNFAGKMLILGISQLLAQQDFNGQLVVTRNVLPATTSALQYAPSIVLKVTPIWAFTVTDGGCRTRKENTHSSHKFLQTLTNECLALRECINSVVCATETAQKLEWSTVVSVLVQETQPHA